MTLPGYDNWKTSGQYTKELLRVHCSECDEWTAVDAETEYGSTSWTPDECRYCGAPFEPDADTELDEPPEPDYDRYEEYGRLEPYA